MSLTIEQQRIVRHVVSILKEEQVRLFFWNYTPNTISFPDDVPGDPIIAKQSDLDQIHAAGLFSEGKLSLNFSGVYHVFPIALNAVRQNFGWRKIDIVLRAMYELAEGDRRVGCVSNEIAEYSGLPVMECVTCMGALMKEGKIEALGANRAPPRIQQWAREGPRYRLTDSVWASIDDPEEESDGTTHGIHVHNSNVGAISTGNHAQMVVEQNVSGTPDELLQKLLDLTDQLVEVLRHDLPQEFDAIKGDITEIQQQIKSGEPKAQTMTLRAKSLFRNVLDLLDFGNDRIEKSEKSIKALERLMPWLRALYMWFKLHGKG